MKDIDRKIKYIFYYLDGIYQFCSHDSCSDYAKRTMMRMFFIFLDSLVVLLRQYKNLLFQKKAISVSAKKDIEDAIRSLDKDWTNEYEAIRNKFAAHQQQLDLLETIGWWNEISYDIITIFYDSVCDIMQLLIKNASFHLFRPVDYQDIDFSETEAGKHSDTDFFASHDRFAVAKKNTCALIPCNAFQEKCATILGIVNMTYVLCAVTLKSENYQTNYKKILFDCAWLLMICDLHSLIENMYDGNDYDKSMIELSYQDWAGLDILKKGLSKRNEKFEDEILIVRNKVAAHVDSDIKYSDVIKLFYQLNLADVHSYFFEHANIFRESCLADMRTSQYAKRDYKLGPGVVGLAASGFKPF